MPLFQGKRVASESPAYPISFAVYPVLLLRHNKGCRRSRLKRQVTGGRIACNPHFLPTLRNI